VSRKLEPVKSFQGVLHPNFWQISRRRQAWIGMGKRWVRGGKGRGGNGRKAKGMSVYTQLHRRLIAIGYTF